MIKHIMMFPTRKYLRLCASRFIKTRVSQILRKKSTEINENLIDVDKKSHFNSILLEHKDKIAFSSYLEREKLDLGYYKYYVKSLKRAKEITAKTLAEKSLPPIPLILKYNVASDTTLYEDRKDTPKDENRFQLPFASPTKINITPCDEQTQEDKNSNIKNSTITEFDRTNIDRWMTNYEHFDDSKLASIEDLEDEDTEELEWCKNFGTPDPNIPISHVPCGGCGALLHCNDPAIPGYLPSELFRGCVENNLKGMDCQRCHFLKEYNVALDVTVQPEEYEKLLQNIRNIKSLVLLMVDLLDFPCSIWPGIVDIIGTKRPLFIVGNKVDLLPGDSIGYLKRIKESLISELNKSVLSNANIKHVGLISAKTGYGVEELITTMFKQWMYKGDVFLVGCTNVGKSSLFNALLQSDYCKVHAADIVKRATISRWPGTTLNLLKFPINRPSGWKLHQRYQRLKSEATLLNLEKKIRKEQAMGKTFNEGPSLMAHIGRTFTIPLTKAGDKHLPFTVFDEKHEIFARSKWFYDTPGVIHPDQVLSLLSTEELLMTIPKSIIRPQTYYLYSGYTLFLAGLARVDFVDCIEPCRFTIFCSDHLPITIVKTEHANEVYYKFVGTELFAVPTGGVERLRNWPGLHMKEDTLDFTGEGPKVCCGDIILSSIGWVSVTAKVNSVCKVKAWTPGARGIYKRVPSMLPYAINLKGKRIPETPAYSVRKVSIENID